MKAVAFLQRCNHSVASNVAPPLTLVSLRHETTTRTHPLDYRPKPAYPLPKRPFVPPRKREAFATHPTPTLDPFTDSLPKPDRQWIQEYYPNSSLTDTDTDADGDVTTTTSDDAATQSQTHIIDDDDENIDLENPHHKLWPYKKWLWRSEKNMDARHFDPKQQLEWFIDDTENKVGRAWYTPELRAKSNEDLWRLWYVLLREKNMLNTIRFQCRAGKRLMPNYGRLEKVNKSMGRLMAVWNERTHLKFLNRRVAFEKKKEANRNVAIEFRRKQTLEKREEIKELFRTFVEEQEIEKAQQKQLEAEDSTDTDATAAAAPAQ